MCNGGTANEENTIATPQTVNSDSISYQEYVSGSPHSSAEENIISGTVIEIINVEGYTYLKLSGTEDEIWLATSTIQYKRTTKSHLLKTIHFMNLRVNR